MPKNELSILTNAGFKEGTDIPLKFHEVMKVFRAVEPQDGVRYINLTETLAAQGCQPGEIIIWIELLQQCGLVVNHAAKDGQYGSKGWYVDDDRDLLNTPPLVFVAAHKRTIEFGRRQQEVTRFRKRIEELEGEVIALRSEVAALKKAAHPLSDKLPATTVARLAALLEKVDAANDKAKAENARLNDELQALRSSVATLADEKAHVEDLLIAAQAEATLSKSPENQTALRVLDGLESKYT